MRNRLRRLLRDQAGSMLIELVVSMTLLVVAVGALMSLYASTVVDMRHASTSGNALTLADRQMEVYKTLPYTAIQLSSSTIPGGSDPYVTANAADSTIPASSGQITGGSTSSSTCSAPTQALPECATQNWTGPDGLAYRIDSYIVSTAVTGGRNVKQVTIVVRRVTSGTAGTKIWSRATSVFDQANPPQ